MPRTCTVCTHRQRAHIDRTLLQGVPERTIADRFGISKTALHRHKAHIGELMLDERDRRRDEVRTEMEKVLRGLTGVGLRALSKAEEQQDHGNVFKGVVAVCRPIELALKLAGVLDASPQHNELHLHLTTERALQVAQVFIQRHGAEVPLLEATDAADQQSSASVQVIEERGGKRRV